MFYNSHDIMGLLVKPCAFGGFFHLLAKAGTMGILKKIEHFLHRFMGRSHVLARIAVKVRNQANSIISYHLGETASPYQNGEFQLIEHLSPLIHTFVDVGANIGEWSQHMMMVSGASGVLFEPSEQCVKVLKETFRDQRVVIRAVAVSDKVSDEEFSEEIDCGVGSTLSVVPTHLQGTKTKIRTTTLDIEFADCDKGIDFVKIDTEGFDLKVLKGAENLLSRIRFLQFEYNWHWLYTGSTLHEAMNLLGRHGFSVFLIRSTGIHPLSYQFWGEYFRYSNYFACRESDLQYLKPMLKPRI